MRRLSFSAFALLLLTFAISCGGGGSSGSGIGWTGHWSGNWESVHGGGGSFDLDLFQLGTAINGAATFFESPCFSSGTVTGTVGGNVFTAQFENLNSAVTIELAGKVVNNQMSGSYIVTQDGACQGDSGTFVGYSSSGPIPTPSPSPIPSFTPNRTPSSTATPAL